MPTSELAHISPIINRAIQINPKSVLDIGIGAGKYGHLLREVLDIAHGRLHPGEWETTINGVEGFQEYADTFGARMWGAYNDVFIHNFRTSVYSGYDLVLMIDSLEHVDKEFGLAFLKSLIWNNENVIVSVPWGANYLEQGAVFGNEFERHRAKWSPNDFKALGGSHLHTSVCTVWHFNQPAIKETHGT